MAIADTFPTQLGTKATINKGLEMKRILLSAIAILCLIDAKAATIDDFVGTWKMANTTKSNYFIIKKNESSLAAVKYTQNTLTNKIVKSQHPAKFESGILIIDSIDTKIAAKENDGGISLILAGEGYEKVSTGTESLNTNEN